MDDNSDHEIRRVDHDEIIRRLAEKAHADRAPDDAKGDAKRGRAAHSLNTFARPRTRVPAAHLPTDLIGEALRRCGGTLVSAAKALGITRGTLYRRIEADADLRAVLE